MSEIKLEDYLTNVDEVSGDNTSKFVLEFTVTGEPLARYLAENDLTEKVKQTVEQINIDRG
ncbi:hypothetical protein GCM10028778_11870 [Barrientosiimonas marina]|uniref:Uncharacterized protein n=1 Tax=Lentibacillus kimchii TaxID=1542911 RepID=A0ABW2V119_9BACI